MEGIFHEMQPGGGYKAGLANWMEPEHLKSVGCCRRGRQYIRMRAATCAVETMAGNVLRKSQAPKAFLDPEVPESVKKPLDLSDADLNDIDEGVRRNLGLDADAPLTCDTYAKLQAQTELVEAGAAHGTVDGHGAASASAAPQS